MMTVSSPVNAIECVLPFFCDVSMKIMLTLHGNRILNLFSSYLSLRENKIHLCSTGILRVLI